MAETPNIAKLRGLAERLSALLADPHPGLFSWRSLYGETMEAIARFWSDEEPSQLRWTREKPTAPGWYWYRDRHMTGAVEVCRRSDGTLYGMFAMTLDLDECDGEWAGPIPEPTEPEGGQV